MTDPAHQTTPSPEPSNRGGGHSLKDKLAMQQRSSGVTAPKQVSDTLSDKITALAPVPASTDPAGQSVQSDQSAPTPEGKPTRTTIYFPAGISKRLRKAALEHDTSVSAVIASLAEGWLDEVGF